MAKNWAVSIGINGYKFTSLHSLKYAKKDAVLVEGFFRDDMGFDQVWLFSDDSPEIRGESTHPYRTPLLRFFRNQFEYPFMSIEDSLWLFFSGHGVRYEDQDYVLPIDGDLEAPKETAISLNYISERLSRSGAGSVVIILDACRIEGRKGKGFGDSLYEGVTTIFSCRPYESSWEIGEPISQGAFTYVLLQNFRQQLRGSYLTVEQMERELQETLSTLNREYGKPTQTPHIRCDFAGKAQRLLFPTNLKTEIIFPPTNQRNVEIEVSHLHKELILPLISGAQSFEFEVVALDTNGKEIDRIPKQSQYVPQYLDDTALEMVIIPGGEFLMGSSERRPFTNELPTHLVTIKPFLMSRFPITKSQWKSIAKSAVIHRDLKKLPIRSGSVSHPVTAVSWYDAIEFCDRLSQITGHSYRLPNEAEWEYACRAGTTTAFHFGETITPNLANYDGNYIYGSGPKGPNRGRFTSVYEFQIANNFGLSDMHGNVWEWCLDQWHSNYDGAPVDGNAWVRQY